MTTAHRIDSLEKSREAHGQRIGALERLSERLLTISQIQVWAAGLIAGAVILAILARIGKLI